MGLEEKYKKYPNENLSVYAKAHTRASSWNVQRWQSDM